MTRVNLSKEESNELVTKGYLRDTLEEVLEGKNYVTKEFLEEVLDRKDYATNDRLDIVIEEVARIKIQLTELGEENRRHMLSLMEDNRHQISILIEAFQARFERIERKVFG